MDSKNMCETRPGRVGECVELWGSLKNWSHLVSGKDKQNVIHVRKYIHVHTYMYMYMYFLWLCQL